MTLNQMEYIIKLAKKHDTFSQNGQWNFSQVEHLVKMANVITTYLPTYLLNLLTYPPTY
jgi:hypothetical protein